MRSTKEIDLGAVDIKYGLRGLGYKTSFSSPDQIAACCKLSYNKGILNRLI